MKKNLLLLVCAFMCALGAHAQIKHVDIAPGSITPMDPVVIGADRFAKKAPRKVTADDVQLGKKFLGACYKLNTSTNEYEEFSGWEMYREKKKINGKEYDVMYDLLPTGIFNIPVPTVFYVSGNKIIVPPQLLAQVGDNQYVCAIDYEDLSSGGTGAIELEVGSDGGITVPSDKQFQTYGYFVCTVNPDGESISSDGTTYLMCAMLTYSCTEPFKGDVVPATGEVKKYTYDNRVEGHTVKWNDHVSDRGYWQIQGSDNQSFVTISPNETYTYEGTWTLDEMDQSYTYFLKPLGDGTVIGVDPSAMTVTLKMDEKNVITVLMSELEWTTGIEYQVTCIYDPAVTDGISDVTVDAEAPCKVMKDGKLVITKNGKAYNVSGVEVK